MKQVMTPTEAIEKLDTMQKQVIHGSNLFGDIADVIRWLEADARLGQSWRENSSLEEWFPFTAEELEKLRKDNRRLVEACHLVLLFHSGSPWDDEKQKQWREGLTTILCPWEGEEQIEAEATTKNLCNAVRAALKA